MRNRILLPLIFLFILNIHQVFAQVDTQDSTGNFSLQLTGFEKAKGEVRIAMFNSEESYKAKKEPVYAVVLPVDSTSMTWEVERLPEGNYAIAVYHDENKNGKLDTNLLGIPKERYGFSNNARGRFGPASWKDAVFITLNGNTQHSIELK